MLTNHQPLQHRSWSWLLRHILLPLGDRVFQQQMMARLIFLEKAQWWEPEQLHQYRDRVLQEMMPLVYREVPFYRRLMLERDIQPETIGRAEDLHLLPVVTKDMLRAGFPQETTRRTGYKTRMAHTSGSTGKNFRVLEDTETTGWYRAAFMLALEWSGWPLGIPHLQTGMSLDRTRQKQFKDALLRCHYVSAYDLTDTHLDEALALLEKHRLEYLFGYPGSLYYLARRAQEVGWNRPLRSAVTWGDNLFPHYRQMIETAFQTRVFDTYGCAEGIQISAQCEQMNYHVYTTDTIVEYLDEAGEPVGPQETGYLVLTRLHPGAMPLIRYRIGDIGVAGTQEPCACGRGLGRMASVQGRDTDVVITPAGNRLIVHFFTGILEYFPEIDTFQVVQEHPEEIMLRLVPTASFTPEVVDRALAKLRERGAADMRINVELVNEIPLPPTGKRRFVINRLQPQPLAISHE